MERKSIIMLLAAVGFIVPSAAESPVYATERRRTANVCSTDVECPDNAFCKAGSYCVCKDGYVYSAIEDARKMCLKVSGFRQSCDQDVQCTTALGVHAICFMNMCICKPETELLEGRCYKISVVGERCITDYNCYNKAAVGDEQAICIRGYCSCQLQYRPRDNGTRCVRDAVLGDKCVDEQHCAGVGLECRGTCRCKEGFAAHNQSNACIEIVEKLGDPCDYDVQCNHLSGSTSGAALCLGGVCSCKYNALERGDPARCYYIRRTGQVCQIDQECFNEENEPGFCRGGHCTCPSCIPDMRDFEDHPSSANPSVPQFAAVLVATAILAAAAIMA